MEITQLLMTKNSSYTAGRTLQPSGVMAHATGTPGADAKALKANWDKPTNAVGTHMIIDETGVYQLLPDHIRAAHCGGKANNTHLSFEVCEFAECRLLPVSWVTLMQGAKNMPTWAVKRWQEELKRLGLYAGNVDGAFGPATRGATEHFQFNNKLTVDGSCGRATLSKAAESPTSLMRYPAEALDKRFQVLYNRAVELTAFWCKQYQLNPALQVIDHAEGHVLGLASNHADTGHWFPQHGKSMDTFRKDVVALLNGAVTPPDYRKETQARFGFAEETMAFLSKYQYAEDLFRKLATSK